MIKVGKVINTHRYTKDTVVLYEGNMIVHEYMDRFEYKYREADGTKVTITIYEDAMSIKRQGEVTTSLMLKPNEKTLNPVESPFGTFEIEVTTYRYEKIENKYCVEYDVENGMDDKDGFIVELVLEGEQYEFH